MTVRKYSSRAQQTTLAFSISALDTNVTVVSGINLMGGKTPSALETYTVVIDPDTALEEIVDVSNYVSGNSLNPIVRGRDGSSAVAHSAGAVVRHMVIGRDLQEANNHIEASAAVHGLSGTVVGTTDTQVISNKTLGNALAAGGFKITGLAEPTSAQDAATKNYADSTIATAAASATASATSATSAAASASAAATSASSLQAGVAAYYAQAIFR
jgi:hypothetical protein